MNVFIGCESSGVVRRAFRALGHNAISCDLLPAADGSPHHIQGDVLDHLDDGWDLGIFHPTCTYLCLSGVWAFSVVPKNPSAGVLYGEARMRAMQAAADFFLRLYNAPIARVAVENPVMHGMAQRIIGVKSSQTIQPYDFGDDASKRTCLWLKGLQRLVPTQRVAPRMVGGKPRWANQTDSGQNRLGPSEDRWKLRAATYPGIAAGMASQWSEPRELELTA